LNHLNVVIVLVKGSSRGGGKTWNQFLKRPSFSQEEANTMAPRKQVPCSMAKVKDTMGITFSLNLQMTRPQSISAISAINDSPQSLKGNDDMKGSNLRNDLSDKSLAYFEGFGLEAAVKTVSSISLMRRMRKRQGFRRPSTPSSEASSSPPAPGFKKVRDTGLSIYSSGHSSID
jgi:hypothetical protein